MWAAQSLIQNTHCENLEPMLPTPRQNLQNRIQADVIVHATIVFNSNSALQILQPFVKILNTPGDLKVVMLMYYTTGVIILYFREHTYPLCQMTHCPMLDKLEDNSMVV